MKSLWLENQQAEHLSFCLLNFEYFLIFFSLPLEGCEARLEKSKKKQVMVVGNDYLDHIDHDYDDEGHDDGS